MQQPARQQPARQTPPVAKTTAYRSVQGKKTAPKRKKQQRRATLLVMTVLVAGMLVVAIVVAGGIQDAPPSQPQSVATPPVSQAPVLTVYPEPLGPQAPARTPSLYDEAGLPILLNYIGRNFVPDDYALDLKDVGGGQKLQYRAAEAFLAMQQAAKADGIDLRALSGYRSHDLQYNIFHNKLNLYLSQGKSQEQAEYETLRYHAYPGTSEHEAGLAMDVGDGAYPNTDIKDSFDATPAYTWMRQHCTEFGFIFRYGANTEDITGIAYEPWHYRYVGANHAQLITQLDITLEEYLQGVEDGSIVPYEAEQPQAAAYDTLG